jgi:hypothetical protein
MYSAAGAAHSLDIQAHTIQLQVGLFVFCPIASPASSVVTRINAKTSREKQMNKLTTARSLTVCVRALLFYIYLLAFEQPDC